MPYQGPQYKKIVEKTVHMNKSPIRKITQNCLIVSILLLSTCWLGAQTLVNNRPINQTITRKAADLLQKNLPEKLFKVQEEDPNIMTNLGEFLGSSLFQTELLKNEWYDAEISRIKKNLGIDFTAGFQFNEYGVFFDDDEDISRLRVGLDLEVLDEGYLKWRKEQARLKVEQQIHNMKASLKSKERNYAYLYNCLIYSFNISKAKVLKKRIGFLESYLDLLYQLYFAHEMAFEKIIDQKSRLEETRILLDACTKFNEALEQELGEENVSVLNADKLPIVQIDVNELLNQDELNVFRDSLGSLENEAIELKYAKRNDAKLKLFSRYNYGDRFANTQTRTFFSFGANFRIPVIFDGGVRKELEQYEKAMVQDQFSEDWYNRVKEIMILYEEYQHKLKQYSNFVHNIFHVEEKLRQERVLLDSRRDVHSPMKALKQIDNIRAVQFELIHLKQQLYLLMLKIHLRSFQENFSECLIPLNMENGRKKYIANRILKFEPSPKLEASVEFLVNYLIKNEIYGVLLQPNAQSKEWATAFGHAGITVYQTNNFLNTSTPPSKTQTVSSFQLNPQTGKYWIRNANTSDQTPLQLRRIPTDIFKNRNELERWIELENQANPNEIYLFDNIEMLMRLDQKNLGME